MSSEKVGTGVDTATQARLYFYNELAARYPGAQPDRVRRSRTGDELRKVPKDAIDSLLNRVGTLFKSPPRPAASDVTRQVTADKTIPVEINSQTKSVVSPTATDQTNSADKIIDVPSVASNAAKLVAPPLHAIKNILKHFRTDKYIYVANDAGHTAAKSSFLRFPNRTVVWSIAAIALFALALGSYFFMQQRSIDRQNAIEQSQFEQQRQAWQCALQTYEQQQGKQINQETVCSK